MTTALVTAIGGDLGQAIARALRDYLGIIGCDADTLHTWTVGPFADAWFHKVPRANDPQYLSTLAAIVQERGADLLIPASEPEIAVLAAYTQLGGAQLVQARPAALVRRFLDKWETAQAAKRVGVPFADTTPDDGWFDPDYDTGIWKPRTKGSAEKVFQEYLVGPEYTVAVWVSQHANSDIRVLALRKELRGGATYRCWYDPDDAETQAAQAVGRQYAEAFGFLGSLNVQGRYVAGRGFIPFEVNPRFSSTTSMRATLGFADAWWSVQEALGREADTRWELGRGRAVRYWAEMVQVGGEWR